MGAIAVRLADYRVDDAIGLTEAVFEDAQGRFWHAQRIEADRGDEHLRGVTIQHARLDRRPTVGTRAGDYDELTTAYGDSLRLRHFWHELILAAFRSDEGSDAVARTIAALISRKSETRSS